MQNFISLAIGGLIGTLFRDFVTSLFHKFLGSSFPYGTLIVNLSGCFIIGFIILISEKTNFISYTTKIFLITGFCGAYTTFSALIFQFDSLLKNGFILKAYTYLFSSIVFGVITYKLGYKLSLIVYKLFLKT